MGVGPPRASAGAVASRSGARCAIADLELDLEVFSGPFDLLLTLVLREEVDLLEVELADVVLAYLDILEARGELDLEAATEFLVLIAALLELKSRLMLPREDEELLDLEPGEAAEELLARMLEARRYRARRRAPARAARGEDGVRYRCAPLPPRAAPRDARRAAEARLRARAARRGARRAAARCRRAIDLRHLDDAAGLGGRAARSTCARCCAAARCSFDEAVARRRPRDGRGDALRAARALQAGEADWEQDEPFGEITIERRGVAARSDGRMSELARIVEALLFLSPEPVAVAELADALRGVEPRRSARRSASSTTALRRARGIVLRELAGGCTLATDPDAEDAARRLLAKPRTPPLTPAQAETLAIVAYLQPVSRPEITRIRGVSADSATATLLERGLIEEAGRSQFGAVLYRTTRAVPEALRPATRSTSCPTSPRGTRRPRRRPSCASACCAPARPAPAARAAGDAARGRTPTLRADRAWAAVGRRRARGRDWRRRRP